MNLDTNPLYASCYTLLHEAVKKSSIRTYFDVGANNGGMVSFAADDMAVHAFEPIPSEYKKMCERWKDRSMFFPNNVGVSDKAGFLEGVTVVNAWTLAKPGETDMSQVEDFAGVTFDVSLITLDDYCEQNSTRIGILKLDVDGYEYRALKGAACSIQRDRPWIYCELSYLPKRIGDSIPDFVDFVIDDLGYEFVSNDGVFHTTDRNAILDQYYPWETSFDVMLLPKERDSFFAEI